jgi:hypothetical protein
MADVSDLYDAVKRRECILFIGAGVHYPPPPDLPEYNYPPELRPPLGAEFSQALARECQRKMLESSRIDPLDHDDKRAERAKDYRAKRAYLKKHRDDLQRTSWFYELNHQREQLIKRVSETVDSAKKPSAIVRALAEIDFPIVITTNYDRLYEQALGLFAKTVSPIIYNPERNAEPTQLRGLPKNDGRWLFKIHGCVSHPESIVITDEDYIRFAMRMNDVEEFHPIPQRIRSQLSDWPTLFVGYSLLDYNLRLLFRTLRWRIKASQRPPTFSLDLFPDLLIRATYGVLESELAKEPLVTFIARNIWRFVPHLYEHILGRDMPP